MLDSMSVEPYETSVESCVGNDSGDRYRAVKSSLLSGRSRRTVYGFSFPGLSSISGEVGIFKSVPCYDVVFLNDYCYFDYC